jgi:hypothetical protein
LSISSQEVDTGDAGMYIEDMDTTTTNQPATTEESSMRESGAYVTVKRPNGAIETVKTLHYMINDSLFAKMKKATKDAGRGDLLSYENYIAPAPVKSQTEVEYDEILNLYDRAERCADYDAAKSISLSSKADRLLESWRTKYPIDAAKVKAKSYSRAEHVDKAVAGSRALERLEAGEDHTTVIAEMEVEWFKEASRCVANN